MLDTLFRRRPERYYPQVLYDLALDLFALVQFWQPTSAGAERGRLFEKLLYRYANTHQLPVSEQAGSRTVRRVRSASGFRHENDAVLAFPEFTVHFELKHLTEELSKNELLIFNQKGIDYLLAEGRALRSLPLYRIILSGGLLSPAARRFAVQWGILAIEPDRLPFLILHELCGRLVPPLSNISLQTQNDLWEEVPRLIVPLQHRLVRIGRLIQTGEECVVGDYRLNWAIDHAQRILGDYYWDALDEHNPRWLEERYESVSAVCGLTD
jgi:hypothetical protein